MRYLLLSVLVVCAIGVMVPSVSANHQGGINTDQAHRLASEANERERIVIILKLRTLNPSIFYR